MSAPRCAFVLGGGGKWGSVEVGMLRALVEAGIQPDIVLGTSIGALNGAVFAADPGPIGVMRLERLWRDIGETGFLGGPVLDRVRTAVRLRVGLNDPSAIRDIARTVLDGMSIEDLEVPFQCVAASIERAAEHWFTKGPIIDALAASAAIPGLFAPVEIDGEHFYDGGLVNSIPVDRAVELGASEIYVLQVGRVEQPLRPPTKFWEPALIAFEISRRHRFASVRDGKTGGADVHVLPSANALDFDDRRQLKWRDIGDADELAGRAYEASRDYLAEQMTATAAGVEGGLSGER
ncbi:patatin-like phospholipase family protein [Microbacterium thalassium]|uniref:NTE family protein n=1 Tax=Microbacterium thalassium TaxID=362649 RepID=A0A7X0FNL3_9MICO|nr:patatin-like phospholipase family protein [Microbacterium thalassium]MBB6390830.1 NTE family protein [Microbacterium thalassium]GLK25938.1 patatin [Microbacterium thalassium]